MLDRRLVFVTGKGGVGRTTVAAALGLAAARAGRRAIVAEVAEQERLGVLFGVGALDHGERELAPGLHGISIDPSKAIEEWLRRQLKSATLAGALGGSRIFQYLAMAAPGLPELVTIGKVWDLAQLERHTAGQAFDIAIVDAPATGHGLAMLRAPATYESVARVGPVSAQAGTIHRFLADPACTAVLAVALPEEMPVNETIDLEGRLADAMGRGLDAIVVNAVEPQRFKGADVRRLEALDAGGAAPAPRATTDGTASTHRGAAGATAPAQPGTTGTAPAPQGTTGRGSEAARAAVRAALMAQHRSAAQQAQLRRLRRAVSAPVVTLPRLSAADLLRHDLERLSRDLERKL